MVGNPKLKRAINLPLLILYGVGNMVGVGFYALMGKVAGLSSYHAPFAFLVSALVAYLSAYSFSELCVRYPVCAGPARYLKEAFGNEKLSALTGYCVITTGVVSAATIATAFLHFLNEMVLLPPIAVITAFVLGLGALAVIGIYESVIFAAVITLLTVSGLMYSVVFSLFSSDIGFSSLSQLVPASVNDFSGIMAGAFVGFYAFIGFEDLVCNAEEVVDVRRTMPKGIFASISITSIIYLVVSTVAVLTVDPGVLASSRAPVAEMVSGSPYSVICLIAVGLIVGVNGALTQIIMASRMLYGLAVENSAPSFFEDVNENTRTPVRATVFIVLIILLLALFLPMITLAKSTSFVMLIVFALVNLAHWKLAGGFTRFISLAGFFSCIALLMSQFLPG